MRRGFTKYSEVAPPGHEHGSEENACDHLRGTRQSAMATFEKHKAMRQLTIGSAHPGSFHAGLLFQSGSSTTGTVMLKIDMILFV